MRTPFPSPLAGLVLGCLAMWCMPVAGYASQAVSEPAQTLETPAPVYGQLQQNVRAELEHTTLSTVGKAAKARLKTIVEAYETSEYKAFWISDGAPSERALEIIEVVARADEHGLDPADYAIEAVNPDFAASNFPAQAAFEVRLSEVLVTFAQHLNAGRLDPQSVTRENVIYPETISATRILEQASTTLSVAAYLRLLAPRTPRYERLRRALSSYKAIARQGGWPEIAEGPTLKPEMEDERVPALRQRLAITGDYRGDTANPSIAYDEKLVEAVKYFQWRHGLETDGVIGPNTLKEINIPVSARLEMMENNLERRRWMQDDYGDYYVFANLADQVLKVVRNGKTVHAELIQVGLPYHRTPVFNDEMEYIEINPYWNVPKSIAVNELLPKLRRNANALGSQNFEVLSGGSIIPASSVPWNNYGKGNFPVRLRQRPGTGNALGRVKFMFPNRFNVYIHDTPSKSKFDRDSRYFSHGCLRLKDPLAMAHVILEEQGWTRERIDAVVASKKRTVVKLDRKIPVHVAYMTAWVNKDGSVHFRRDVYGRDKTMAKALSRVRG